MTVEHTGEINQTGEPYGGVWECDEDCPACTLDFLNRAIGLLRSHVTDWGGCDHPIECECSDGRAIRFLAEFDDAPIDVAALDTRQAVNP